MTKSTISTDRAPRSKSPLSQAIRYGDFLFVSGQVPVDPQTGSAIEGDIRDQTRQCMENLGAILAEAGSSFEDVLKTTCFLVDIKDADAFNETYASYFSDSLPARSTFQVAALASSFRVEIEAIAVIPAGD